MGVNICAHDTHCHIHSVSPVPPSSQSWGLYLLFKSYSYICTGLQSIPHFSMDWFQLTPRGEGQEIKCHTIQPFDHWGSISFISAHIINVHCGYQWNQMSSSGYCRYFQMNFAEVSFDYLMIMSLSVFD